MSRDDESFVSHRASPYRAKKRDDCRHKRYEEISLLMVIHECHSVVGLDLHNCVVEDSPQIVSSPLSAGLMEVHMQWDIKECSL